MKRRRAGGGGDEEVSLDDRGRAVRAARYILDGMRLFRISLGTLALLLFLALVCCILSSIFVGLDLKSDMSISVEFIEDDGGGPVLPPQDGDGGELEPTCSDSNSCTADFEFDSGGCESIPFPEGTPCQDVCIEERLEGSCEYVELQKGITKPICIGACLGTCDNVADCPDIVSAEQPCEPLCPDPLCREGAFDDDEDDPYCDAASDISEKCYFAPRVERACRSNTCFYRARLPWGAFNVDGPINDFFEEDVQPVVATDDIPEMGCRSDSEYFLNYCMGLISDDDPLKSCLVPIVECEFRYLNQDVTNTPEQRQGDPFVVPQCHYHFWCTRQPLESNDPDK